VDVTLGTRTLAPPRGASRRGALGILFAPVTLLILLFLGPLVIMVIMSVVPEPPSLAGGFTLAHYTDVLTNELNRTIALNTAFIATTAMVVMLLIAIPLAYHMAFKARRGELVRLLALVAYRLAKLHRMEP
jgi:ABC-type spermidine/putrescine transport system permease subunit I